MVSFDPCNCPRDLAGEELSKLFKVTKPVISTAGAKIQFSPLYFLSFFHSTIQIYYNGDTVMVFILVNIGNDSQCLSQAFG